MGKLSRAESIQKTLTTYQRYALAGLVEVTKVFFSGSIIKFFKISIEVNPYGIKHYHMSGR